MGSNTLKNSYLQTIRLLNKYILQDLEMNNPQGMICHKTPTTNQPLFENIFKTDNFKKRIQKDIFWN